MQQHTNNLITIFETANANMVEKDIDLFTMKVAEQTFCGALMLQLHEVLKNTPYAGYYVDVEYNRNKGGTVKTYIKTIAGPDNIIVKINCDLIVHSRGRNKTQDNLIAIEMKKSSRKEQEKTNDRHRLVALTKNSYDDVWSYDGKTLPEHVCGYALGIYYEIDFKRKCLMIEYYVQGMLFDKKYVPY